MSLWRVCSALLAALWLGACSVQPGGEVSKAAAPKVALPAMKLFPPVETPREVARSNQDLFEEFLDLTFSLESGQNIARLSRFEGKIFVSLRNAPNTVVGRDLDRLIERFQTEANLPIYRVAADAPANIVIEMIPKRQLYRVAPNAACIVVPRVRSFAEYRKSRWFTRKADWTSLRERQRALVLMPVDVSPQDARDCLHEEIAQALGPLNDLYRVADSVYNDDNFHLVLTPYDMMILRIFYAPELRSGMAKHEVAAVLPGILARENPAGIQLPAQNLPETPSAWIKKIEKALAPRSEPEARIQAASKAIRIALRAGITDHRLGFSYYSRARVSVATNPQEAAADYARAYAIFARIFGPYDIHTTKAGVQMAYLSMAGGNYRQALAFIEAGLVGAQQAQNGRMLFSLLAMKAEIYEIGGRPEEAQSLREEAVAWGQYGLYPHTEIHEELELISRIPPRLPAKES